jgi:hypothetical protein
MSHSREGRHRRQDEGAVPFHGDRVTPPRARELTGPQERPRLALWTPEPPSPDRASSRWHWLLVIPVAAPLLIPWYDRAGPSLLGLPFFYWCQLAFIPLSMAFIAVVHMATRGRE